jgi:hypothetical protein
MWWGLSPPNESYPLGCPTGLPHPPPGEEVGLRPRPLPLLAISNHLLPSNASSSNRLVDSLLLTGNRSAARRRTRILIADAQPLTRIGLYTLLSNEPDLEVVGEVAHGAEVESAIARVTPDLLSDSHRRPRASTAVPFCNCQTSPNMIYYACPPNKKRDYRALAQ